MHWTAGFRVCYILAITAPPPVMSNVDMPLILAHDPITRVMGDAYGARI
jgi:hypothetical protein